MLLQAKISRRRDWTGEEAEYAEKYSMLPPSGYCFFVPSEVSKRDGKTRPRDKRRRESLCCFCVIRIALSVLSCVRR